MLTVYILKRVVIPLVTLALMGIGALWAYGFLGVKCGWIGPTEVRGLNAISHSGAQSAGGEVAAMKLKAKNALGL